VVINIELDQNIFSTPQIMSTAKLSQGSHRGGGGGAD